MKKSHLCILILIALLSLPQAYSQSQEGHLSVVSRTGTAAAPAASLRKQGAGVKSIDFDFVNDKRTYKDKRLLGILGFKKGDDIDAVLAEFGRDRVEEYYRKKGFAFIQVALDEGKLAAGKVVYQIDEGPKVKIGKVSFNGNESLRDSALKKVVKTTKKNWFLWPKPYTEETVTEDLWALKNIYWDRGFLDSNITVKTKFTDDRSKVNITFTIEERTLYIVEKILLKFIDAEGKTVEEIVLKSAKPEVEQGRTGRKPFDEKLLLAQVKLEPGEIYNGRKAKADVKRLLKLYREQGFIDAKVELLSPVFIPDVDAVNVECTIFEGPQFRIGRIDITGNRETQDKVFRRILDEEDFQPGRWYNADIAPKETGGKLEKSIQNMTAAEAVSITPLDGDEPGQKNAELHIKEGKTRWGLLGAGISLGRGLIGQLEFRDENFDIHDTPESFEEFITGKAFRGAGQKLRISLRPGLRESMYSVSFTEPYLHDKPESLNVTGSGWERENYKERYGFGEQRTKGYVGFSKWRKDAWGRSLSFRWENVDVGDFSSAPPSELKDIEGDNMIGGIGFGIGKRTTDDRFRPTTGYEFNTGYEQLGGDHTFGILTGTHTWYRTLYEDLAERKTVLAVKLLGAATVGDAPAFEKFYGGGMGTYGIRGFRYRGVSTRAGSNNDPVGSDWLFLANAEVSVPLVSESLTALFFIDSGAIDSGGYRLSVGSGVEIGIPLLGSVPMRLQFGVPIMKDEDDDTRIFSFSVGMQF
ncbi:MAG TPA: POTRA domain-containing protein [Sedimentisphaerales bacterium]|nr:POTRA domain-containing protein [Sedimentisphaerales bacterium]